MLKPFIINNLKTVKLNFGPQHPAAHGVLRLIVNLDGEIISEVDPHIGFLHRGTEKLLEFKTYSQGLPYFDRLDYVSVLNYEHAFSLAIEKLLNYDIPIRASFIRVIFSELTRLLNHLMSITTHAMDVGAITPFLFGFEERERIMEFYERVSGARMHANYIRVGGVAFDLPIGIIDDIYEFVLKFIKRINEIDEILTENKIWLERLQNVGVITYENVLNFGFSGVIARSVGINSDLRKKTPYEIYDKVSFDIPMSYRGDCYDRYVLRMKEMRESCKIILQLLDLPFGPIKVLKDKSVNVSKNDLIDMESVISHYKFFTYGYQCPSNIVYSAVEAPKGEFGVSVVSKNSNKPYRCSLNRPGFKHCAGLNVLSKGYSLTDMVTIVGTLDLVLGEIDC